MSAPRVYLFADFGKGPVSKAARDPRWPFKVPEDIARFARDARAWWLVECESADAGRRVIAGDCERTIQEPSRFIDGQECPGEARVVLGAGRILDSGGAPEQVPARFPQAGAHSIGCVCEDCSLARERDSGGAK